MVGNNSLDVACAQVGPYHVIKPVGACTAIISTSIRDHVHQLQHTDVTDIYFDLSITDSVDSTFIGLLLTMVGRKYEPGEPEIHLLNPSESIEKRLTQLHVITLFDICELMPEFPTDWRMLSGEPVEPDQLAKLVIEAHEELIHADSRNVGEFSGVVDGFRKNLKDAQDKE